jgi:hypothetical protein
MRIAGSYLFRYLHFIVTAFPRMKNYVRLFILFLCPVFVSTTTGAQNPFFNHFTKTEGLPGNSVYDLLVDDDGTVWFATNDGIAYYVDGAIVRPEQPAALLSANVLGLFKDNSSTIWVWSEFGTLFYGNKTATFKSFPLPKALQEISENKIINSIQFSNQGNLFIATVIGGGLYKIQKGSFQSLQDASNSFMIQEVDAGRFLWGSSGSFPPDHGLEISLKDYPPFNIQLSDNTGFSKSTFLQLKNGSYLFAKDYELVNFKPDQIIQRGFLPQKVESIYESSDDKIWVALNNGGVVCYLTERFSIELSSRYLSPKTVTSLVEDKEGNIWFATLDEGVFMLPGKPDVRYQEPKILVSGSGKEGNEQEKIAMDEDRINFLPIQDPLQAPRTVLLADTSYPSVFIGRLEINNKDTSLNDIYHLEYDQNFISIHFSGFVDNHPEPLQYKYRLEGKDSDWVFSNVPNVSYSRLIPGEYVFTVFSMDNKGKWSPSPAKITFFISPPFWSTSLFYAALIIFFLLFAVLILFWGLKRSRERAYMNKQTLLAELNILRAQMNPHFTFNTLSSIQHFIGNNDNDAAISYLSKFAKLMRSIMENTKKPAIPVQDDLNALRLYLDLERLRLNEKFDYEMYIDPKIDPQYDQIPSMLIQPYVENAIWHGLTHKKEKGLLKVELVRKGEFIICDITDNGIGRAASRKLNGARSQHTSMGMKITKERLEIINSLKNSTLSVDVTDLMNEHGDAQGTKVEIFIPLDE